jgi:hypothetical protein
MSERDYSWQPLSLHTISSGANSYFFSEYFWFTPNTPLSSPRPPLARVHHSKLGLRPSKYLRPHFRPLHAPHYSSLGNELLVRSNTSFTDPLFRHLSCAIALSICAQLTNVRITRSLLAISSLLNPPHYGFSERPPDLAGKVHYSGARGIPFTALLPHPSCMSLAAITWLYMSFSTGLRRDAMHTFTPIRGSCTHVCPFFRSGSWTS